MQYDDQQTITPDTEGTSGTQRQAIKFEFLDQFMSLLEAWMKPERGYSICGDWNIAHKKIDLKNWQSNQKNSGFLAEERAWMDELLGPAGWRIDCQITRSSIADRIHSASINKEERFSDHAPLIIEYNYSF